MPDQDEKGCQIRLDKQNAVGERIARANNENEFWKVINDITKPISESKITLIEMIK